LVEGRELKREEEEEKDEEREEVEERGKRMRKMTAPDFKGLTPLKKSGFIQFQLFDGREEERARVKALVS